ncbi:transporter substrate-binding domain-containing protein [Cellvibrio sp. PSBB006]|uniref:transporter substrate-binding domain-containing protein n=1 Tax=Cellvibrio sp. PSBB006 TaxID=1987723 RepID=UPI0012F7E801|nr:transporter substrate-binding domain-containing protein [Cellvibrio sp. PSBB006]
MKSLLALLIPLMAIVAVPGYANDRDKDAMVYRYWDWGITPQRDDYQVAILKLALEKTRSTHGDYKIERKLETLSRSRAHRAIAQGEFLNIHASPLRPLLTEQDRREQMEESIPVKIPLMKSLLGYRSLIIRRRDYEQFSEITDAAKLKSLVAGQGRGWTDISIYEHNKYQVRGDAEYFTLFSMLLAGRFDYIPLSVIEVNGALSRFEQYSDSLMVLPDLMLYYPLPTLFHVSAKHPALADRLERGLTQARQDGSLDRLFEQHFSEQVQQMKSAKLRVFVLENPGVPTEMGLDQPLLLSPKQNTP